MRPATYLISLTVLGILTGVAILPVFGRFSNTEGIAMAKRKIRAALYEFRLFGDDPRLVFRAQGELLRWNARYIGLILKPAAVVILPIIALTMLMDTVYGHRALQVGEDTLVTARMANNVDLNTISPELRGTNITVETPSVRLPDQHEVVWGVRAAVPGNDNLSLSLPGDAAADNSAQKSVDVGTGLHILSGRRVSSWWDWLIHPGEKLLPRSSAFRWIEIQYPDAEVNLFGFGIPWIVWFIIVSWITVFALRKPFGVII
ncbi:MAG TPA: hypothetical protein VMF56_15795 [Acidobacteriaceae bacterium]|nr:hypothetical protein [Acidobacteriaceae bacterium]